MPLGPDPHSGDVVYSQMRWNTPLSEDRARLLLEGLAVAPGDDVVDLGCGWGELLIRAIAQSPQSAGTGVDNAEWALNRGRALALEGDVADRIKFVAQDASTWTTPADRVLCIGAAHAWGGASAALRRLCGIVRPGGRLLFGDGCWEQSPTSAAAALFGESVLTLAGLVEEAMGAGWHLLHLNTANQDEWDDFESTWKAGREGWLLANRDDPRATEVRTKLANQWQEYLSVYRGVLGFAYLTLAR
jgi:cyclopropane fatty-acyl-phospholipid synthase-like methyltransferase